MSYPELVSLANQWLEELRGGPEGGPASQHVVLMNFVAPPETQWEFVKAAVAASGSDDELGHVAAGPFEHLLGHHGDDYIEQVERMAAKDPKFLKMLAGAWQYQIPDGIWSRVQALLAN